MLSIDPSTIDLVIYHGDCMDGFGAAFAAWKRLGSKATYHAAKHGDPPPDVTGKNVAIIDFCYKRALMLELQTKAKSLIVLDHHKTAREDMDGLDFATFDMNRSGAMLSWNFFHKNEPAPMFLQMIEDADLWKFDITATRDFISVFYNTPYSFRDYDAFLDANRVLEAISTGRTIREFMNDVVVKLCKNAVDRKLNGYLLKVINCPLFMSDIGNMMATMDECDIGMAWYFDHKSKSNRVSLRSVSDAIDVSEVAKKFGGGGHPRAAGFQWVGNIEDIFDK